MPKAMRTESDSVGSMQVPADVYYGVQTLRGYENFHITGSRMNWNFIKNIAKIKKVAAKVNGANGYIPADIAQAIVTALCPYLGYKKSAELAKEALAKDVRIRDLILRYGLMEAEKLDKILDPYSMT